MKMSQVVIAVTVALIGSSGVAGACEVPGFLEAGKSYKIAAGRSVTVKLLEIDKDACWIKVQGKKGDAYWMNVGQIVVVSNK